jgi:hypothetical protein
MAFERKLVSLHVSPWSERAKWALDHHRLAYTVVEHVPIAGERRLRLHPTCPVEERGRTVKIAALLGLLVPTMGCTAPVGTPPAGPARTPSLRTPAIVNQSPAPSPLPVDAAAVAPDIDSSVYGLLLGSDCTDGGDPCAAEAYEGPLVATWDCYAIPNSTRHACSFRRDDFTGVPLGGDAQVSYAQTMPPICTQLGGTCVPAPGLPTPTEPGVILANDGGSPSLCVVP